MKSLLGLLLLVLGALSAINPEIAWQLDLGWKFKDAEPSDMYFLYIRVSGIISCIIGLILIFVW